MSVKTRAYLAFVTRVEYASVIWSPYTNCGKGIQRKAGSVCSYTQ